MFTAISVQFSSGDVKGS